MLFQLLMIILPLLSLRTMLPHSSPSCQALSGKWVWPRLRGILRRLVLNVSRLTLTRWICPAFRSVAERRTPGFPFRVPSAGAGLSHRL